MYYNIYSWNNSSHLVTRDNTGLTEIKSLDEAVEKYKNALEQNPNHIVELVCVLAWQ
jgi:hypothetical protein